jgi:glycosyltransferase involved in cell wall biosynthesis
VARVALVCEPPDGGVAEHVAQLALGLGDHGHEAIVLGPAAFAPAARLAAAGCEPLTLDFKRDYGHPASDARVLAALVRILRGGRFDLVHAHAAKAGVLARAAAVLAGVPAVYSPHCFPFVGEVSGARRVFALIVERLLARRTAAVVCVCEAERELASASGIVPRASLAVVRNGCPPCEPVEPEPALAAARARGPVVGCVTALRRQKRLDVLIAAAPRVLAAVPDATIAVVGDGPESARLRARAATLRVPILFLPYRPPSARALAALDVYVLSSGWEALPIAVLEAQACGVPQVATDVGGVREAVTPETGVLVPAGDPAALADAVIGLLGDPVRRDAMAAASRDRHATCFTVERMVAETAEIYDAI